METKVVSVRVEHLRSGASGKKKYNNLAEWVADTENNVYIARRGVVLIDKRRFPEKDSINVKH